MATSVAGTTILDQLIDEIKDHKLGYKFTGTATASGVVVTTTDPEVGRSGSDAPSEKFLNWYLFIPSESGDDLIHTVLSHATVEATGVTTFTTLGPNYGSTTTDGTMYLLAVHPSRLLRLFDDALDRLYTDYSVGISTGPDDSHFQDNNTTSWAATSNVTVTKTTTASEVYSGVRAGDFAFSDAGYSQSTLVKVGTGANVYFWAIAKADVGTGSIRLVDASDNSLKNIDFTQEVWLLIANEYTNDTTDEQMRLQIRGAAGSDVVHVQEAHIQRVGETTLSVPSWVDERFKIIGVSTVDFGRSGTETDTWEAEMLQPLRLREDEDFRYINRRGDVNPHKIQILKTEYTRRPLFLELKMPYSQFSSFTTADFSDTTTAPQNLMVAYLRLQLHKRYSSMAVDEDELPQLQKDIGDMVKVRNTAPPPDEPKSQRLFR